MKTEQINIRDPFILTYDNKYYLYGTRSATTWGPADGFDCYVSDDLENWSEPVEIFHNDGSFWADRSYWAPECYYYNNAFYLMATFKSEKRHMGIQILKSDSPVGPFTIHSDGPVTPEDWEALDGTLYIDEKNIPYMIFSHSFVQVPAGDMCALQLTPDLKAAVGQPFVLFNAEEAPWSVVLPFAKAEFGTDDPIYLSDGPYLYKTESGALLMLWSSFNVNGYAVGIARSENGRLVGPWSHDSELLFAQDGGHGMIFYDLDGQMHYALHYPNEKLHEHPKFVKLEEKENTLRLVE